MSPHDRTARPLLGFRVGVTAARRQEEQVSLLERRGAQVTRAPVVRTAPLTDDSALLAVTHECLRRPPDLVLATTGIGFHGWCEAADGWGLGEQLLGALRGATVLARGPKTVGAIRAAGLREGWSAPSETLEELLDHALALGVAGRRVALQEYGERLTEAVTRLRAAGADVVVATVYRCETVADRAPVDGLVEMVVRREVDAVTFTSAPAVTAFLESAEAAGRGEEVLQSLRDGVAAACVGPVTAAPLRRSGVPVVQPDRARLGAMVRELAVQLPARRRQATLTVAGRRVDLRGAVLLMDGEPVPLSRAPRAVLDALAERPGQVWSRRELLPRLPSGSARSEHAVEMAVARVRAALGAGAVQTVVKRGYRLQVAAR
ncbi:MAG: uroporphyrinogen-III synthase [Actinomycetota bacterium]|nr:uroporphyrinogen-III synthase [Actinomycetota bacterium]